MHNFTIAASTYLTSAITAVSSNPDTGLNSALESVKAPIQMISLGMIILAAHLGGKLCRRLHFSEVTGQILGGALVGPYFLYTCGILPGGLAGVYTEVVHAFHFFIFVFLSTVAFGIGEELHLRRLKQVGRTAFMICIIQGTMTWLLIFLAFYFIGRMPLVDSLLIGSIGIATAPAVTFVLMNQLRIEGRLRHVLGSLVVLDDMIEVVIFSILMQISLKQMSHAGAGFLNTMAPVGWEILMALLLGGAIYLVLRLLVRRKSLMAEHSKYEQPEQEAAFIQRIFAEHPSPSVEILLIVMGAVSVGAGIAYFNHWPFLITATFAGFMVANLHTQAIFDSLKIENVTAVLNLAFFALIGANIDLSGLAGPTALLAGLYIVTRLTGKMLGTWLGCKIMGEERKVTACLPSLMLPQAGVAAVESVYASVVLGKPEISTIILPAIVFFEITGVIFVERGLKKWRTWVVDEEKKLKERESKEGPGKAAGKLLANLNSNCIITDLHGTTKKEVIDELIGHAMSCSKQHIDRHLVSQVINEREKLASTGIGYGVAIPHCRLMGVEKPILIFGIHKKPIDYGGVDNIPCDLFLLLLTSSRDPGMHLELLSAASHIFGNEMIRSQIRGIKNPEEFLQLLSEIAERRTINTEDHP